MVVRFSASSLIVGMSGTRITSGIFSRAMGGCRETEGILEDLTTALSDGAELEMLSTPLAFRDSLRSEMLQEMAKELGLDGGGVPWDRDDDGPWSLADGPWARGEEEQ